MPGQQQIFAGSVSAAPKDYDVGAGVEFRLYAVTAEFTDNGAGGDWLPAVELISDSGHLITSAADQGVKVTAGSDAEVSWFPGVKHAASSPTPPASGGLAVANLYQSGFGPIYPASGSDVFPFDTAYASPTWGSTDTSILDIDTTTAFNGNPVVSIVVNAPGTYAFFGTWNVRAADGGVTSAILSWSSTGGVGPSTFFQGRYGADPHDTWQNTAVGGGTGELFLHQWFLARAGHVPFFVTLDTVIQGVGNVVANPSLYAIQLSPTALSSIT